MKSSHRTIQIAQQVQVELAKLIRDRIKDPRLGVVTITDVEVSRDLAYAKIYCVVRDEQQDKGQSLKILNKAAAFLRRCLAKELVIRTTPELQFLSDTSASYGERIDDLLRNINIQSDEPKKD